MRLTTTSIKKSAIPAQVRRDPFIESMKGMIEHGLLANTPANAFKSKVIEQVQSHSAELAHLGGGLSALFLDLCDLLVSGRLSKMPAETFKTYMAVMTYSCTEEKQVLKDMESLKKMTGISDQSALDAALEHLKEEGYIESVEEPIVKRRPSGQKDQNDAAEKLFS